MLSSEGTEDERTWSLGTYTARGDLGGVRVAGHAARAGRVFANEPNP